MFKIQSLERLVHELGRWPGIGPKTAQRLAYNLLRHPDHSTDLRTIMQEVFERVKPCPQCFCYTEAESLCSYCKDPTRLDHILCVVEEPMDVMAIESSGVFRGRYHVLHGVISPLERISPEDLTIGALIERVRSSPPIEEIILVLDADLEGDTTVLYLNKIFGELEKRVRLTRIAHGVPIGGDIDYIDHRTIGRALENRVEI